MEMNNLSANNTILKETKQHNKEDEKRNSSPVIKSKYTEQI